jgi:hypothetical protein
MRKPISAGRSLLVGAVAVGALSLGTAGVAGAAAAPTPHLGHFNCARATKVLTRIEKTEAHITAGLPKLKAREGKALAKDKAARAARLEKRIAVWESAAFQAKLTGRSAAIEAKCHVSAPPAP